MICGITFFIKNLSKKQVQYLLDQFHFGGFVDLKTGEEIPEVSRYARSNIINRMVWRKAMYQHMELLLGWKIDQLTGKEIWHLKVIGSIHKSYQGGSNHDYFSPNDAVIALMALCKHLNMLPSRCVITQLEIGINIPVLFLVHKYLENFLLRYWVAPFEKMKTSRGTKSFGYEASLTHHQIKLYEKDLYLMRFEIHYSDMQELRTEYKLKRVSDLNAELILKIAEDKLVSKWQQIVILDHLYLEEKYLPTGLSKKDKLVLLRYSNNKFIDQISNLKAEAQLTGQFKEYRRLLKADQRGRERFNLLIRKHGDQTHSHVSKYLIDFFKEQKRKCLIFDAGVNSKNKTIFNDYNNIEQYAAYRIN